MVGCKMWDGDALHRKFKDYAATWNFFCKALPCSLWLDLTGCCWCSRWCCRWAVIFISYGGSYNTKSTERGARPKRRLFAATLHISMEHWSTDWAISDDDDNDVPPLCHISWDIHVAPSSALLRLWKGINSEAGPGFPLFFGAKSSISHLPYLIVGLHFMRCIVQT